LLEELQEKDPKVGAIEKLNAVLENMGGSDDHLKKDLVDVQKRFLELSLPPDTGKNWVTMQIEERWKGFFHRCPRNEAETEQVWKAIRRLKKALYFGQDPKVVGRFNRIPNALKLEWVDLIYKDVDRFDASSLERLIQMLASPAICIPSRERSKKTLIQLKVLAENMSQLERNTNFLLRQVLNGGDNGFTPGMLSRMGALFE
jgi:hypothetical protein